MISFYFVPRKITRPVQTIGLDTNPADLWEENMRVPGDSPVLTVTVAISSLPRCPHPRRPTYTTSITVSITTVATTQLRTHCTSTRE